MTRPLLLIALALALAFLLRRREPDRAPARWLEDDDGVLAPDPWTVGLLGLDRVIAEDRDRGDWRNATKSYARDAGLLPTGVWVASGLTSMAATEHARPILEQAMREGRKEVYVADLWWTFTETRP